MSVTVNSATTNYFDYLVNYNYNTRQITITNNSSYKVGGEVLTQGINFYIKHVPTGQIISNGTSWGASSNLPPSSTTYVKSMAFWGAGVNIGEYIVIGTFKDQSNTTYTLEKDTTLCLPTQDSTSTASNGAVTINWSVRCIDNLIIYQDVTSFALTVNGTVYGSPSITYSETIVDPLGVILASASNVSSIQFTPVVNGSYSINVDDTAVYTIGDGVTVTVHFILSGETKKAECNINLCDVYCCVKDTYDQWVAVQGQGSTQEKTLRTKWEQLSLLIGLTQIAISCGNDTSELLEDIEEISGCDCSCGCGVTNVNQGVNVLVGQNIVVQAGAGIGVSQVTVGNTTTVTVTNSSPDTNKVLADAADTTAGYLDAKLESSNSSVTFAWDAVNKQVDTKVAAGLMTGVLNFTVSFETGEVGTIYIYPAFKMTVNGIWATVSKTIAATDNGTITPKNNAGAAMTGGATTVVASSAVGTNIGVNTITANNSIGTADAIQITTAKATAGGRCLISLQYTRTL